MRCVTTEVLGQFGDFLERYHKSAVRAASNLAAQTQDAQEPFQRKRVCGWLLSTASLLKVDLERTRVQLQIESPIKPLPPDEYEYLLSQVEQELTEDTQNRWNVPIEEEEVQTTAALFQNLGELFHQKQKTIEAAQATWADTTSVETLCGWLGSIKETVPLLEAQATALRCLRKRKAVASTKQEFPISDLGPESKKEGSLIRIAHSSEIEAKRSDLSTSPPQEQPKVSAPPVLFVSQPEASFLVTPDPKHPGQAYQTLLRRGRNTTYRGPVFIYATKHGRHTTYQTLLAQHPLVELPPFPRGVIVGVVELVDCRRPSIDFAQLAKEWQEVRGYQIPLARYPAQIPLWFKKGMTWLWEFRNPVWQPSADVTRQGIKPWRGGPWTPCPTIR